MSISRTASTAFATGAICALFASATYAAEMKVSGTVTHVFVSNEAEKLSDGRTLLRLHTKGVIEASDPKSPAHLAKEDCFNTVLLDPQGNIADGGGHCNIIDKDNDGYLLWWHFAQNGSVWNVFHGTGKFMGMSGGGTAKPLVNFADRYTLAYEGTLTMK